MDDGEVSALIFSPPRGNVAVECHKVRSLTSADLPALKSGRPLVPTVIRPVKELRSAHHRLAQMLATGIPQEAVSSATGYSPAYISRMKLDPAFMDLMAYYGTQREQMFIDTLERMKQLGIASLDELQSRLAENPEGWSNREMMEMAELMLIKSGAVGGEAKPRAGTPLVNIKFVTASVPGAPTIDATPFRRDLDAE